MRLLLVVGIVPLLTTTVQAQDDRFQCDDTCTPDNIGIATYNVVSPVGISTVEPIEMAPRLTTLEGKTIAIVGEDFMYNITHPEIGRLIKEYYPTANVIMYDELPIAGPYPAPKHHTPEHRAVPPAAHRPEGGRCHCGQRRLWNMYAQGDGLVHCGRKTGHSFRHRHRSWFR